MMDEMDYRMHLLALCTLKRALHCHRVITQLQLINIIIINIMGL